MKIRMAVPALMMMFVTLPIAWGQSAAAPKANARAPLKIGVINLSYAIANTAEGKQGLQEFQEQFMPRTVELQNLQKQIDSDQTRLRVGRETLSDEERVRLTREYEQLTRRLQRKQQDLEDEGNEMQQEVAARIGRKMTEVLSRYARDNGYTVVLDISSKQTSVISAAHESDITQDVVGLYDHDYPVRSATTAPPGGAAVAPSTSTPTPKP